jgi:hypothetical protein
VEAYVARKRAIIAEGITDSLDYCISKGGFVGEVLETLRKDAGIPTSSDESGDRQ